MCMLLKPGEVVTLWGAFFFLPMFFILHFNCSQQQFIDFGNLSSFSTYNAVAVFENVPNRRNRHECIQLMDIVVNTFSAFSGHFVGVQGVPLHNQKVLVPMWPIARPLVLLLAARCFLENSSVLDLYIESSAINPPSVKSIG